MYCTLYSITSVLFIQISIKRGLGCGFPWGEANTGVEERVMEVDF